MTLLSLFFFALLCSSTLEALNTATGVDQLLLARVEGVAVRANLDVQILLRRPRDEVVTAGTGYSSLNVFRVNVFLHSHIVLAVSAPG